MLMEKVFKFKFITKSCSLSLGQIIINKLEQIILLDKSMKDKLVIFQVALSTLSLTSICINWIHRTLKNEEDSKDEDEEWSNGG